MEPQAWEKIERVIDAVLEKDPAEWPAIIEKTCGHDEALRQEVETLLRHYPGLQSFLQSSAGDALLSFASDDESTEREVVKEFQRIGNYRIIREIAHGGMGRVFLAERADGQFEQQAALKLLHSDLDTDNMRRRFRAERQMLASLNHPNIARLLDGGVTKSGFDDEENLPYLVMEYVEGKPVIQYCDERNLSVPDRLRLFKKIAEAVQHAHRNLIVHCDIKPSNILITEEGEVKLLDFGIARLMEEGSDVPATETQTGFRRWMTPEYAAPEQIKGDRPTVAVDVYQLGVLLYELLTHTLPFERTGNNIRDFEAKIIDNDPVKPSMKIKSDRVRRMISGDLDHIVLKALRKEPELRYLSIEGFIDDIDRYLAHRPVQARRGTLMYRSSKLIRRNKGPVAAVTIIMTLLMGYIITVTVYAERVGDALEQAQREAERANIALAETEHALKRAESLREFLIDLFRAAEPGRPRDQLPDTEELLAFGASRALDPRSAPPEERLDMLVTIGRVYAQQNLTERARELLDAAVELAREYREERPVDLAMALSQRAWLEMSPDRLHIAKSLLLEAESALDYPEAPWNNYATIQTNRGWVASLKGNHINAIELLEPLYIQIQKRDDADPEVQYRTMNHLASVYRQVGNLRAAADIRIKATELSKRLYGPDHLTYAIDVSNSANVQRAIGRYDLAEEQHRKAIELYDRIYGVTPMGFRAVAYRNLSRTLLEVGRFDESREAMNASTNEFALARGRDIEYDETNFYYKGWLLTQMHRSRDAEEKLIRARTIYMSMPEPPSRWLNNVDALLLINLCRINKIDDARVIFGDLESRLAGNLPDDQRERAQIHEARALFYFISGNPDTALEEITYALDTDTSPGRVVRRGDRMILHAQILAELGDQAGARRELQLAEKLYRDVGLTGHPLFPDAGMLRREFSIDKPLVLER